MLTQTTQTETSFLSVVTFNKTNSLFSSLDNIETVNVIGGVLLESRDVPGGFLVPNEHLLFTIKVVYVLYNITPQVIEKW